MENDLISRAALMADARKVSEYDEAGFHVSYKAVPVEVIEKAPAVEAEPVRHEGIITHITTDDLDKYQGMIIVDEGEKSKFCAVYYADNPGWDVFDDLASAYYGKQMYFTQPDGTIYSRLSCGYMTFEEALSEFREAISMDGGAKDV